jgi:hypothetical protein
MRLTELPRRLATTRVLPSGEIRAETGSSLAPGLQVEDGDGIRAGVGHIGQLPGGVQLDGNRLAVELDGSRNGVVFGVDDRDRALPALLAGVDHIDFVAGGAGRNGHGILTHGQLAIQAHIHHVKDGDRAAATVGDIGIFAIVGLVLGKVVGAAGGKGQGQQGEC